MIELNPEQKDLQRTVRELVRNKITPLLDSFLRRRCQSRSVERS